MPRSNIPLFKKFVYGLDKADVAWRIPSFDSGLSGAEDLMYIQGELGLDSVMG